MPCHVAFLHHTCFSCPLSLFCRDPETILSKVREIGDLIATIDVLAMETEVGVSILYVNMLV